METIINFFLNQIESKLHKVFALVGGLVIGITFFGALDDFWSKLFSSNGIRFFVYAVLLLFWVVFWVHHKISIPKVSKGRIGVIIAIYAEEVNEQKKLKNDFVYNLKKSIRETGFSGIIEVYKINNHLCEDLSIAGVQHLRNKTKGHFILWGSIKLRNDGEKKYFLDLDGSVVHRPVNIAAKDALTREFLNILPKQVSFFESFDFKGFSISADIVYLSVRYITGIAAFISGDPHLAFTLHTNLKDEFNRLRPLPNHLQIVRSNIPMLLSQEALIIARHYYDKNNKDELKIWLDKSILFNNKNDGAWLLAGIFEFKYNNDPGLALEYTKKAGALAPNSPVWRYNKTFLLLWLKKYVDALREASKLRRLSFSGEDLTIKETEEFMNKILDENKVPQLYFWLGYLSFFKKYNLPDALVNFEKFQALYLPEMQPLKQKSIAYILEIKQKMKIKT